MQLLTYEGEYEVSGNRLLRKNIALYLMKRRNFTEKKPEDFLMLQEGNSKRYISSLYKQAEGDFIFDTFPKKEKYRLLFLKNNGNEKVIITKLERGKK